jgi:hypothetical protein
MPRGSQDRQDQSMTQFSGETAVTGSAKALIQQFGSHPEASRGLRPLKELLGPPSTMVNVENDTTIDTRNMNTSGNTFPSSDLAAETLGSTGSSLVGEDGKRRAVDKENHRGKEIRPFVESRQILQNRVKAHGHNAPNGIQPISSFLRNLGLYVLGQAHSNPAAQQEPPLLQSQSLVSPRPLAADLQTPPRPVRQRSVKERV